MTHIRTSSLSIIPVPVTDTCIPENQTIIHLVKAFPHSSCPVAGFQEHFQTSFFAFVPPKSGAIRIKNVAGMRFRDEKGNCHQFTWRTIQT
ncbi:MAG: hypothetical protein JW969_13540 [Spirochaetales bacterium]|nr:hypothetical protein [Spirochaetales bacterium]